MSIFRALIMLSVLLLDAATSVAYPIYDIRVTGVPDTQADTLRILSGILPGDDYDSNRAKLAEEKIQNYLEGKGFPQSQASSEVVQEGEKHILRINIVPGPAIHIAEIAFESKGSEIPENLRARLIQAVDLKPEELFDRDRIKDMRRAVEAVLFAQNFIDSKVNDITSEVVTGGLKLNFILEMGQKVVLSVTGNKYYSRSELMTLIEEQRTLGLGRDYVSVLSTRLREQYVEHGFRQVKITPYSFEAHGNEQKKVVFEIDEGQRVKIKDLTFDGNEIFKDSELQDFFFKNAADRIVARIYNETMVESAAKGMIEELKKRGYLSAKLIAIKTDEGDSSSELNLRFFLNEGLQTRVQAIDFRGNQVVDSDTLGKLLGLHEGEPLNLAQLEDGIDLIKRQYRNLGYLNFKISNELNRQIVTYSEKNQYAYLNFELDEGHIQRLNNFDIFGNEKTHRVIIERELQIKAGEPLSERKVAETEEHLRRLGIFSQVNLEFDENPATPDSKDMRISVQEASPGNTSAGVGFRNDLGVRVFGGLSYSNLWGMNHTWALDLTANRRLTDFRFVEYAAQVSYTWPWAFLGETTFRPTLSAENRQYQDFDAKTYAFAANFERMLYKPLGLSTSFAYSLEYDEQFNAKDVRNNDQFQIGAITPSLRMDLRDNPLIPRNGFYAFTSFEYSNPVLGSQGGPVPVNYGRYQVRADYYADFIPRVIWFSSIRGGWLKNFANSDVAIPIIKQFALGGIKSIRGFEEQELRVQAGAGNENRRVQNYMTYINYRTQFDFMAGPNLSFGPFLDAGNLQVDAFSFGNLRFGTGVGMRYLTPVGPINFDWGFKLFPRPGESSNVFYFSIGVI